LKTALRLTFVFVLSCAGAAAPTLGAAAAGVARRPFVSPGAGTLRERIQPSLLRWIEEDPSSASPPPVSAADQKTNPPAAEDRFRRWAAGEVEPLPDGRLLCWVTVPEESREAEAAMRMLPGCSVDARLGLSGMGPSIQVRVPPDQVAALAALPQVLHVGLPPRPVLLDLPDAMRRGALRSDVSTPVESEGLPGMRAPEFWSWASRGEGVRIGIIDVGFAGYEQWLGTELPEHVKAASFYGSTTGDGDISGGGEIHGTACAEIIHDVAPEADIYLANVSTPGELQLATNWMVEQGVEVISHSVGWFLGPGDGTGPIADIVSMATNAGVVWVNAAGNFGLAHWARTFSDADGDSLAEVNDQGSEDLRLTRVGSNEEVTAYLLWSRWPTSTNLAFELELVNGASGRVLTSSAYNFGGYPYAYRAVYYRTQQPFDDLRLRVRYVKGSAAGIRLRVFRGDGDLVPEDRVPGGSLSMPADSPKVLSVGAFAWDALEIEGFSSRGPNAAGLAKPEILGPDGVSTSHPSTEFANFYGTSAACPHVAGAVGLLLSASPQGGLFDARWTTDDILHALRVEAGSMAPSSDPAAMGWGHVRLPVTRPSLTTPPLLVLGNGSGGALLLRLISPSSNPGELSVFDVTGRLRGTVPPMSLERGAVEYDPAQIQGVGLSRGIYWALEGSTSSRVSFYWPGRRP
jgi:subtilisin family serine protease